MVEVEPPEGCTCASFWTVRQAHKSDCPLAMTNLKEIEDLMGELFSGDLYDEFSGSWIKVRSQKSIDEATTKISKMMEEAYTRGEIAGVKWADNRLKKDLPTSKEETKDE